MLPFLLIAIPLASALEPVMSPDGGILPLRAAGGFDPKEAERIFNACRMETGAEETFLNVIVKDIIPTTHKGKCLSECLMRHKGIHDADSNYTEEGATTYFNMIFPHKPHIAKKAIEIASLCHKMAHQAAAVKDKCELTFDAIICSVNKYKEEKINIREELKNP